MESPAVTVAPLTQLTDALLARIGDLVGQLSSSAPPPDREAVETVVSSDATHLVLARDGEDVLGMLTLVVFTIPTGVRALVEDVVVDEAARGRGVGQALVRGAVELARAQGARTVDLTSRPSREAANRLYRRMGFVQRETNVYRFDTSALAPDADGAATGAGSGR